VADIREFNDFIGFKFPKLRAIISGGLMYEGNKVLLYGKYKSMKSMICMRLALNLSQGKPWLGFELPSEGISSMYLQLEMSEPLLQQRYLVMTGGHRKIEMKAPFHIWTEFFMKLDTDEGLNKLNEQLEKYHPAVLIVDPLYKIMTGNISEAQSVAKMLDGLDTILAEHPKMSMLLVNHTRKSSDGDDNWGSDDMIGSSIFSAWADSIIKIEKSDMEGVAQIEAIFDVVRHATIDLDRRKFRVTEDLDFTRFNKPSLGDA
jgi:RecA-family ATPase